MTAQKNYAGFFIILLCTNFSILASVNIGRGGTIQIADMDDDEDNISEEKPSVNQQHNSSIEIEKIQDAELLETSFAYAPAELKSLVLTMKTQEKYAEWFNTMLLTGPAGSGKSTLARAIAHKLDRKCVVVHAPSLLGKYRDQAAENVRQIFKDLMKHPDNPVLIVEEMNALTDNHFSEHSDTQHTAMQLWTLLDMYRTKEQFLFIGTTNETKKMPHQLQSRFQGKTFVVAPPAVDARRASIELVIKKLGIKKSLTCDDDYLNTLAQKIRDFSQRDIEALIYVSLLFSGNEKMLSKDSLEKAFAKITRENNELWDFTEHVSGEEKRHRENLAHSKKQFEENINFQIKLAEWRALYETSLTKWDGTWSDTAKDTIQKITETHGMIFPEKKPEMVIKEVIVPGIIWPSKEKQLVRNTDVESNSKA